MAESVDAAGLKPAAHPEGSVRVRVPSRAPAKLEFPRRRHIAFIGAGSVAVESERVVKGNDGTILSLDRASLTAEKKDSPASGAVFDGGAGRSRTGLDGFAIRCITALLPRR